MCYATDSIITHWIHSSYNLLTENTILQKMKCQTYTIPNAAKRRTIA
jgi:hypothetical protein